MARLLEHPASLAVLILLIIVLLGWKRLPDMARNFGRSTRILKSEIDELKSESAARSSKKENISEDDSKVDSANTMGNNNHM